MNNGIIGILFALLGALVMYFKKRADTASTQAILNKTAGEDKSLAQKQLENQAKIDQINKEIQDLKRNDTSALTPQERADSWNSQK